MDGFDPRDLANLPRLGSDEERRLAVLDARMLGVVRRADGFAAADAVDRLLNLLDRHRSVPGAPDASAERLRRLRDAEPEVSAVATELIRHGGRLHADIRELEAAAEEAAACLHGLDAALALLAGHLDVAKARPSASASTQPDLATDEDARAAERLRNRLAELTSAREGAATSLEAIELVRANAALMRATAARTVDVTVAGWRRGLEAVEMLARRTRIGAASVSATAAAAPDPMELALASIGADMDEVGRIRADGARLRAGRRAALERAALERVEATLPPPASAPNSRQFR